MTDFCGNEGWSHQLTAVASATAALVFLGSSRRFRLLNFLLGRLSWFHIELFLNLFQSFLQLFIIFLASSRSLPSIVISDLFNRVPLVLFFHSINFIQKILSFFFPGSSPYSFYLILEPFVRIYIVSDKLNVFLGHFVFIF